MAYEFIRYAVDDGLAVLTLDRPARLNAMHAPMLEEILDACGQAELDDAVRALILTGVSKSLTGSAAAQIGEVSGEEVVL